MPSASRLWPKASRPPRNATSSSRPAATSVRDTSSPDPSPRPPSLSSWPPRPWPSRARRPAGQRDPCGTVRSYVERLLVSDDAAQDPGRVSIRPVFRGVSIWVTTMPDEATAGLARSRVLLVGGLRLVGETLQAALTSHGLDVTLLAY